MIGCLCLHGFTGEPWEVEPVAEYFLHNKKWLVYTPTLPGHERDGNLKDVTYTEWLLTAELAVKELLARCERVYVIGFSLGGMLACYIAARYPITKLVLLSAAAYYVNPLQLLQDLKDTVRLKLQGKLEDDEHYLLYRQKIIDTPLAAVYQFMQAIRKIRPYVHKVNVPTLIIQGDQDGIVPPKTAIYLFNTIRAVRKEIMILKEEKHMICHGFEKELLIEKIETFFESEQKEEGENMRIVAPKPFTFEGGKRAVMLLHGFTGTTADVRMLGRYLQGKGYTCHAPLYDGHGVPPEQLLDKSPEDWWRNVVNGYEHLKANGYDEIAVVGLSLGGVFSLKSGYTLDVKGITTMCAPIIAKTEKSMYDNILTYAKGYKQFERKTDDVIEEEMKALKQIETEIPAKLTELFYEVEEKLHEINVPLLVIQAKNDEVIDPKSAERIYNETSSKQKTISIYEHSTHVITLGAEKQRLHEEVEQFLNELNWTE